MKTLIINGIDISNARSVLLSCTDVPDEDIFEAKRVLEREFPQTKFIFVSDSFKVIALNNTDVLDVIEVDE